MSELDQNYCGGIIYSTDYDLDIISCENFGALNNKWNAGIIAFVTSSDDENKKKNNVNIIQCGNFGVLNSNSHIYYCYGIIVTRTYKIFLKF